MRPQTLRYVGKRRLVSNLVIHSRCPHRQPSHGTPTIFSPAISAIQTRSLYIPKFLLNSRKKAQNQQRDEPPGLSVFTKLISHLDEQIGQRPDHSQVVRAMEQFVTSTGATIPDHQAYALLRAYEFVCSGEYEIPIPLLQQLLPALHKGSPNNLKLARLVYADLLKSPEYIPNWNDLSGFARVLCHSGNSEEAAEMCLSMADKLEGDHEVRKEVFHVILAGFLMQKDENGLLRTLGRLEDRGIAISAYSKYLIRLYCDIGDFAKATTLYAELIEKGGRPDWRTTIAIIGVCMKEGNYEWPDKLMEKVTHDVFAGRKGTPAVWEMILQWSAIRKGPEEVERLLHLMQSRSLFLFDIQTFNSLISFLRAQGKEKHVARIFELQNEFGIESDRKNMEMQIVYYVKTGNLDKAKAVYDDFRFIAVIPTQHRYKAEEVCLLLQELAKRPSPDVRQVISEIYNDLVDWNVRVGSETLCALLKVYLVEASFEGVKTLLDRHIGHYSPEDRKKIINLCTEYIFDPNNSVEASWDMYRILVQRFPELSAHRRGMLMNLFFELGRPNMAVRVFKDMGTAAGRSPTKYLYTAAFAGIARAQDLEGLLGVHRMLNMDPFVQIDTVLLNSIMFAYARNDLHQKALSIYDEIARSPEGPDEATFAIVLDVCGRLHEPGLARARQIWKKLKEMGVPLSQNIYTSYIESLAREGQWEASFKVFKDMKKDGVEPGYRVISTLFNTMRRDKLVELEAYLEENYAVVWNDVKQELNAAASQPVRDSISGGDLVFADDEGKSIPEPRFKSTVNLAGSEGYDEAKAQRDWEEWERRRTSTQIPDEVAEVLLGKGKPR